MRKVYESTWFPTAVAGVGVIHLFEGMLRPHLDSGALEPILESWWERFSGPFLYYPGRRHVPAPLRVFVEFLKACETSNTTERSRQTTGKTVRD